MEQLFNYCAVLQRIMKAVFVLRTALFHVLKDVCGNNVFLPNILT